MQETMTIKEVEEVIKMKTIYIYLLTIKGGDIH